MAAAAASLTTRSEFPHDAPPPARPWAQPRPSPPSPSHPDAEGGERKRHPARGGERSSRRDIMRFLQPPHEHEMLAETALSPLPPPLSPHGVALSHLPAISRTFSVHLLSYIH